MTNTLNFSKSKYCELWQCPKITWLRKYKPEQFTPDDSFDRRMETGNEVGELAKGLFGSYVEVTARDGDRLDLTEMIRRTSEEVAKQTPVICEASFSWRVCTVPWTSCGGKMVVGLSMKSKAPPILKRKYTSRT